MIVSRRPLTWLAAAGLVVGAGCDSSGAGEDSTAPVVTAPVVSAPVVSAPVVSAPVVSAPVVSAPTASSTAASTAPAASAEEFTGQEHYVHVVDRLVDFSGGPLLQVAHLAGWILQDEGFPSGWWGRLNAIVLAGFDRERYGFRVPVTIERGASAGAMVVCIGDECHEMVLFGEAEPHIAVDGVVLESMAVESPDGYVIYGWCTPDTIYAYGSLPDRSSLPMAGQSALSVYDAMGPTTEFIVDIDRQALSENPLPEGWSVACQ